MQTPKARASSLEVPQRTSPSTPQTARKLKATGSDSETVASPKPSSRTPKERSPKVTERNLPRTPVSEKKRLNRVSELESQLSHLQEELRKAKEQLNSSESLKRRTQQEAEEAKKQLAAMSAKLEESQKQLVEFSDSEEARLQELRKISQDRDRAWQSELEAVQKQHSMDSAALSSAMNEIQKLKVQLERVAESEAAQVRDNESAHAEIQSLRLELTETISLIEKLKMQLKDSKECENQALEEVRKTQMQLESAKATEEKLRSEDFKAMEACKSLTLELEQSNARVKSLEELFSELQSTITRVPTEALDITGEVGFAIGENEEASRLKTELNNLKSETGQLKSDLEASERRYQEEYIKNTLQIRSAYELVEQAKSESCQRESELEANLKIAKYDIEELKKKLMAKESTLQNISEENKELNLKVEQKRESELEMEVKKREAVLADLKVRLLDKDVEFQNIREENEMLKLEIEKKETESSKVNDEALASAEAARATEQETLVKFVQLTEEADKSSRKAARVIEQLDAAQAANSEMEADLRRLKVQSDQWRKAAEAAAAMLTTGNNGKYVERTCSLDYHAVGAKLDSTFPEQTDDDSPKKKNSNMLKKIGVLLKKGQK